MDLHPDHSFRLAVDRLDEMRRDAAAIRARRRLRLRPDRVRPAHGRVRGRST